MLLLLECNWVHPSEGNIFHTLIDDQMAGNCTDDDDDSDGDYSDGDDDDDDDDDDTMVIVDEELNS